MSPHFMNFGTLFQWITGRKTEPAEPVTPTAPPPPPPKERRVSFRLEFPAGQVAFADSEAYPVADLSFGGLSVGTTEQAPLQGSQGGQATPEPVLRAMEPQVPPGDVPLASLGDMKPGQVVPARITLGSVFLETPLRVCTAVPGRVGFAFAGLSPNHARVLNEFLKPRILGASLREIPSAALKNSDPTLRQRWFQGDDNTQMFLWQTADGKTERVELSFLDYVISLEPEVHGLRTGTVRKFDGDLPGLGQIDPNAIVYFQIPSHRALRLGRALLEAAPLPAEAKDALLTALLREEKCSFNRFILGDKDRNIKFVYEAESGPIPLQVANLCGTALAFLKPPEFEAKVFPEGFLFAGRLKLPEAEIPARVKLVYAHEQVMGGRLMLENPEDGEHLSAFLAPRLLGRSLEPLPPPAELKPFAPQGSRAHLFVGLHNTHLLALVAPTNRLIYGRLAFMDRALVCDKKVLQGFTVPRGILFPTDWDLPADNVEILPLEDGVLLSTVRQIFDGAKLPEEVTLSWKTVLPDSPGS